MKLFIKIIGSTTISLFVSIAFYMYFPLHYLDKFSLAQPKFGSTITTINGSDTISSSRSVINTNFSNLNTDKLQSGNTAAALTITALTSSGITLNGLLTQSGAGTSTFSGGISLSGLGVSSYITAPFINTSATSTFNGLITNSGLKLPNLPSCSATQALSTDSLGNVECVTITIPIYSLATSGESITQGQLVHLATSTAIRVTSALAPNSNNSSILFGKATGHKWTAQGVSFTSSVGLSSTSIQFFKTGTPTDNITIQVQGNNAGAPDGNVLASSSVSGSQLSGSPTGLGFVFNQTALLSPNTTYWLYISRDGGLDDSNYYNVELNNGDQYAGGTFIYYDSSWTTFASNQAIGFTNYYQQVPGYLYRASSNRYDYSAGVMGIAKDASDSAGDVAGFFTSGSVKVGSLSAGTCYFAGNASGTLSTTAGTYSQKVGCSPDGVNIIMNTNW